MTQTKVQGIHTEEIVIAILTGSSVNSAVKSLIQTETNKLNEYSRGLHEEAEFSELLVTAQGLPEGSAGRTIADAIVQELRENFPEAAAIADARLKAKDEADAAEIEWLCRK